MSLTAAICTPTIMIMITIFTPRNIPNSLSLITMLYFLVLCISIICLKLNPICFMLTKVSPILLDTFVISSFPTNPSSLSSSKISNETYAIGSLIFLKHNV